MSGTKLPDAEDFAAFWLGYPAIHTFAAINAMATTPAVRSWTNVHANFR